MITRLDQLDRWWRHACVWYPGTFAEAPPPCPECDFEVRLWMVYKLCDLLSGAQRP